eukprot:CAMPEP_0113611308 /NCGR_PEP_ID=MMETSP0017_2-20120614/5486_1 /TAXON_ID=2856 /ORGANISM="Cylindrotheca closterium" /LENGTH=74 /DNA_ID=CAMNT_0000520245 /DNA_START=555 /DNA_END=776 /DNA_ORIENTATION=- /assembly_acc=CAM_ASM_000147
MSMRGILSSSEILERLIRLTHAAQKDPSHGGGDVVRGPTVCPHHSRDVNEAHYYIPVHNFSLQGIGQPADGVMP